MRGQRALLEGSEYARLAFARRLKRDITVGYLAWLQASKTVAIVDSSRALLAENLRVNDSLFRNGKITQDQVLRARAELLAVDQQLRDAQNGQSQARSYLNFLLNRDLDAALEPAEPADEIARTAERPRRAAQRGARRTGPSSRSSTASPPPPARRPTSRAPRASRRWRSAPTPASRARSTSSAAAATSRRCRCC